MESADVVTILRKAFKDNQGLFNNAAQSFNHDFYWKVRRTQRILAMTSQNLRSTFHISA
jgi:superoxide dismutase